MRVAFRADASVQIGTGHVMRCLTLADELTRQGHECRFVCRAHAGHLGDLITNKGYGLTLLPASSHNEPLANTQNSDDYARWLGVPWQEDASQTLECITQWKPDWLVVDHYALDAEWEYALAHVVGRIMVIDDLANRAHECSLLLDQNLGRVASDYDDLLPDNCKRLIGPDYALLRPEFAKLREQSLNRRKQPELKRILISLGGVDRTNVTGQVLDALSESTLPVSTELDIIMGSSAPYLDEVRQQAAQLPFKATVSVGVTDMAERMCLADLSIGAAGSTSWERCCLGLPAITVVLAENQRLIGKALSENGAGFLIDVDRIKEDLPMMAESIVASENECILLARQAAMVCDGAGVERVVSVFTGVSF
ncbi:N-Acetylneuraminate cytidylyltransferase [Vibrio cholerae]|uniref:UDP-2,4-diacetamido-2,4, 6-trideoxy-beta-L-altropyranose hydrolase n=1 Tax=Vibrio cholerae TaxID=666 RepID=UPI000BB576B1|nr:UDP-2,4-diacetamido-2,4,6-trideoxy-beta-L-altropyranose hydrolase [Vibrio cholerae]ATD28519.1 N-Acetylneuraminate cytidylyltransferase [Vibrio cholerae]